MQSCSYRPVLTELRIQLLKRLFKRYTVTLHICYTYVTQQNRSVQLTLLYILVHENLAPTNRVQCMWTIHCMLEKK